MKIGRKKLIEETLKKKHSSVHLDLDSSQPIYNWVAELRSGHPVICGGFNSKGHHFDQLELTGYPVQLNREVTPFAIKNTADRQLLHFTSAIYYAVKTTGYSANPHFHRGIKEPNPVENTGSTVLQVLVLHPDAESN